MNSSLEVSSRLTDDGAATIGTKRKHDINDHRRDNDTAASLQATISRQSRLSYTRRTRRKNYATTNFFPKQLFRILEEAEERGEEDIITFLPHGLTFTIRNVTRFVKEVMPRYFRTCRFQSFVRQLNLYGFRRTVEEDGSFAYYHEHFRRDKKRRSQRITRRGRQLPEADRLGPAAAEILPELLPYQHNRKSSTRRQDHGLRGSTEDVHSDHVPEPDTDTSGIEQEPLLRRALGTDVNEGRQNEVMSRRVLQQNGPFIPASVRLLQGLLPGGLLQGVLPGGSSHGAGLNTAGTGLRGDYLGRLLASTTLLSNPLDLLGSSSEPSVFSFPSTLQRGSIFGFPHAKTADIDSSGVTPAAHILRRRRLLLEQNAIEQERRARLVAALNECEAAIQGASSGSISNL